MKKKKKIIKINNLTNAINEFYKSSEKENSANYLIFTNLNIFIEIYVNFINLNL